MDVVAAGLATEDLERSLRTGGPELTVAVIEMGEYPKWNLGIGRAGATHVIHMVVPHMAVPHIVVPDGISCVIAMAHPFDG